MSKMNNEDIISKLVLVGYDNQLGMYPYAMLPICTLGDRLVAVFHNSDRNLTPVFFEEIPQGAGFVRFSPDEQKSLQGFDPRIHQLFAYSEHDVVAYEYDKEQEFCRAALEDQSFGADNQFLRLSISRRTEDKDIIFREMKAVLRWYKTNYPGGIEEFYHSEIEITKRPESEYGYGQPKMAQELSKPGMLEKLLED